MGLKKAMIYVYNDKTKPEKIEVLFNPTSYSISESNDYGVEKPIGKETPVYQFKSGGKTSLDLDLFFDTYEKREDVRKYTKKIQNLMKIEKDLHHPPRCSFIWGNFKFEGVAVSISQNFTMFLNSGIPVRAQMQLKLEATKEVTLQEKEISKQSSDRTKERDLKSGDELWMHSSNEYDDPKKWRHIAKANNIDNPRDLGNRNKLIVPPLE